MQGERDSQNCMVYLDLPGEKNEKKETVRLRIFAWAMETRKRLNWLVTTHKTCNETLKLVNGRWHMHAAGLYLSINKTNWKGSPEERSTVKGVESRSKLSTVDLDWKENSQSHRDRQWRGTSVIWAWDLVGLRLQREGERDLTLVWSV